MLEYSYGLNPKENALISFLTDKKIDFTPFFYNSAIPIKELFYFFVIAENSFDSFNRIPSLFEELENSNVFRIENKKVEDLKKLRRTIRDETSKSGVLIKTLSNEKNAQWEYIKAQGKQFIINDGYINNSPLSSVRLGKIYGGEIVQILLMQNGIPNHEELLAQRLFKPEQYIPFYFVESDLGSIEELQSKLRNMFYVYKVTRYRMMQYYSHFVDIEFMCEYMENAKSIYELLTCLKDSTNRISECFALLHELNQIDVLIMNQLKEKMGEKR